MLRFARRGGGGDKQAHSQPKPNLLLSVHIDLLVIFYSIKDFTSPKKDYRLERSSYFCVYAHGRLLVHYLELT